MRSLLRIPHPILLLILALEPPQIFRSHPWSAFVHADLVNRTVDDSSSEITYSPASSWHSSSNPCSTCLAPTNDLAYQGTWHDGTHIIPTVDADDFNDNAADENDDDDSKSSTTSLASPAATQTNHDDDDDDDDEDHGHRGGDDDDDKGKGSNRGGKGKGKGKREIRWRRNGNIRRSFRRQDVDDNPFFTPKRDSDDEGFVDTPVFAQFNFTGSAVYVFALIPLFPAAANNTPTFVNLTYTLDSQPAGGFTHSGTQSPVSATPAPSAFQDSAPVFAMSGLQEGFHSLVINVGPDSVLLLDFIIYSQDDGLDANNAVSTTFSAPGSSGTSGVPSSAPSANTAQSTPTPKSNNIATFAGAVGGSVGLLAVLALSLALSIYRRRRAAQRRDRQYRTARTRRSDGSIGESFHTDASEDGPPMSGPAPFVPRYFPGTVPAAPPPYIPSNSPGPEDSLLPPSTSAHSPYTSVSWNTYRPVPTEDPEDRSYADRPPSTPPLIDDDGYFAPPPTFGEALASPVPVILARLSGRPISSQTTSPRPPSQASISTPPSRHASRSSLVGESDNDTSSSADQVGSHGAASSQAGDSSLQGGQASLSSSGAQPPRSRPPSYTASSSTEPQTDRPSSSHSQDPPIEGRQVEQEQTERRDDIS